MKIFAVIRIKDVRWYLVSTQTLLLKCVSNKKQSSLHAQIVIMHIITQNNFS